MKLLLDTHAFIWWDSEPGMLSHRALALCEDQTNTLVVSLASLWEIQIKLQLGKIKLRMPLSELMEDQQQSNRLAILAIAPRHVYALESLPPHHKDPFDRMLIAQSLTEGIRLISHDSIMQKYQVDVEW